MDPLTLALMLGPAAIQGAMGVGQLIKGNQMQKNLGPRVGYEIPESAKRALGISERLASSYEMPGAGARRYAQDLQNQKFVAAALQAGNSQDAMAMLTQGLQSAQEGELAFSEASAQNYQQRQQNLQQALGNYAGYQEKKRADEQQAWYEKADRAAQMKGAGLENLFGAGQGLAQAGMMGMMYPQTKDVVTDNVNVTKKALQDQANLTLSRIVNKSSAPVRKNIPGPVASVNQEAMPFTLDEANQQLMQSDSRASKIINFLRSQLAAPPASSTPYKNQVGPVDLNNLYPAVDNATPSDARIMSIMGLMQGQFAAPTPSTIPYNNAGPIEWGNTYPENNQMSNFIGQMYNPIYR